MPVTLPDWRVIGGAFDGGAGSATGAPIEEIPIGPRNGSNVTFTLSHAPNLSLPIILFLNGNGQQRMVAYTVSGNVLTYATAPKSTDSHWIIYWTGPSGRGSGVLRARFFAGADNVNWGASSVFRITGNLGVGIWSNFPSNAAGSMIGRGLNGGAQANNLAFLLNPCGSSNNWDICYAHDYSASSSEVHRFVTGIPNNTWRYIGISRDTVAKTVSLFVGDGVSIALVQTWTYTNNPDGGTDPSCLLVVGNSNGGNSTLGDSQYAPYVGSLQQHYIWTRNPSLADHRAAMSGAPSVTNLVLACSMGDTPEIDTSGTGASGPFWLRL